MDRRWGTFSRGNVGGRVVRALGAVAAASFLTFGQGVDEGSAHTPHDDIFDIAVSPGYDMDETVYVVSRGFVLKSIDGGATWARLVKGLDNKRNPTSIRVSPRDSSLLFLASPGDGIYKSVDAGASWSRANTGLSTRDIAFVAMSPHAEDVAFAAGREVGLFTTRDGGATWSEVPGFERHVMTLEFAADREGAIFAGSSDGSIKVSGDGGRAWTNARIPNAGAVLSIAVSPDYSSDGTLFAGTERGGVFMSADGGASFSSRSGGVTRSAVASVVVSQSFAADATVWVSTHDDGVFVSRDGGDSWSAASAGLTTNTQVDEDAYNDRAHFGSLRPAGGDTRTLFLAGFDGLFKTTDGSEHWIGVETLSTSIVVGLAVSPTHLADSTLAVTTYVNGAFLSEDRGSTWTPINSGLEEAHSYRSGADRVARLFNVAFSPGYSTDGTLFTSSWKAFLRSETRGRAWDLVIPGGHDSDYAPNPRFTIATSPEYARDRMIFLGTRAGEVFVSSDAGVTFSELARIDAAISYLAVSPAFSIDSTLFAGTSGGTYKSADAGRTWTLSSDPSYVTAISISPDYAADGTVFAGTLAGLFVTSDRGAHWTRVDEPAVVANGLVEALAIAPTYKQDGTALVSVRGLGLFRTTDRGRSLEPIAAELIDSNRMFANFSLPTASPIVFSPTYASDDTVYGFAHTEVLRSSDGGETWETLALPRTLHEVLPPVEVASDASRAGTRDGRFSTGEVAVASVIAVAVLAGMYAFVVWRLRVDHRLAASLAGALVALGIVVFVLR